MWIVHGMILMVVVSMFLSMVAHPPPKTWK
jgi:hypothetical protein